MREELAWRSSIPEIRKAWREVLTNVQEIADTQARDHGELTYKFDLATFPLPAVFKKQPKPAPHDPGKYMLPEWKSQLKKTAIFPMAAARANVCAGSAHNVGDWKVQPFRGEEGEGGGEAGGAGIKP